MYPPAWRRDACPPDPLPNAGVPVLVVILACIVILHYWGYDLAGAIAAVAAVTTLAANVVHQLVMPMWRQFKGE